jgi:hypothetical protein
VRIITSILALLLFVATPAVYADTLVGSLASNGTSTVAGTVKIGSNSLVTTLFCDDYTHDIYVPYAPSSYTYNITNIATVTSNFSKTLFGSVSGAVSLYEEVFYLSSLELAAITVNDITTANTIQNAMWSITYPYEANKGSESGPTTNAATAAYVTQAQQNYNKYSYSNFVILTLQDPAHTSNQEQELFYSTGALTAIPTPEPGTAALLIGSVGLVALLYRRKGLC